MYVWCKDTHKKMNRHADMFSIADRNVICSKKMRQTMTNKKEELFCIVFELYYLCTLKRQEV